MPLTSVIKTRTNVITTRRVRLFPHAECDFNTHKVDLFTQSTISTRRVWFYTQRVVSTHNESNFDTYPCEYDTHECNNITLECNIYTHCDFETHEFDYAVRRTHDCDFKTHKSDFYTQNVILTLTSLITIRTSVIYTRRV
jgi:hypothetical protein